MPYSITTQDGISISGIPDDMPNDAPELKQRVAALRAQKQGTNTMDAPSSSVGMGLRDAVDAGAQVLRRVVPEGIGNAVDTFGNWLADKGLPVTKSNGVAGVDAVVNGVNQEYERQRAASAPQTLSGLVTGAKADPGFDWGRLTGNLVQPANYLGAGSMAGAKTALQLAKAGAQAGAVSGTLQPVLGDTTDFATKKAVQAATGAAAGAVLTPALAKGAEAVATGANAVRSVARAAPTDQQIQIAVNNTFQSQGIPLQEVPQIIQQSVQRQVSEALAAGTKIDPAAVVRKAQFEAVGLMGDAGPTLGQATRDPMQFANEKNLSGVRMKTPQGEGNLLADRFQAQNNRLGEVFDQAGATGAVDRVTAGQKLISELQAADAPVKAGVDQAYEAARAMTGGRAAELERATFSNAANKALDEGMWGAFLPSEVRTLLNQISEGKTPFTVDSAVQIDSLLSKAQRRANRAGDDAAEAAVGVVRNALHGTPLAKAEAATGAPAARAGAVVDDGVADVVGRPVTAGALPGRSAVATIEEPVITPVSRELGPALPPGAAPVDEGAAAREAFDQARRAARARFATIEETPALKAALDEAAPDKFVQQFVLGADVRDVEAMKKVLASSPDALAQARAQVADHLKRAAFGENPSGDKAFAADRYLKTLQAIGKQKLEAFFTPAEIVRMNLAGKVASDINSIPAGAKYGTNVSGSGAAVFNLLQKVAESPVARQIPGARMLANQLGEIQTERSINQALSAQPAKPARELSPEQIRAIQSLFPLLGAPGAVLGGQTAR